MHTNRYSSIISSSTSRFLTTLKNKNDHHFVMNGFEDKSLSDGGLFLTCNWRGPRKPQTFNFQICRLRGGNLYIFTWCIKHAMLRHVMLERDVRCCRLNTACVIVLQPCTTFRLLCKLYRFGRSQDRFRMK